MNNVLKTSCTAFLLCIMPLVVKAQPTAQGFYFVQKYGNEGIILCSRGDSVFNCTGFTDMYPDNAGESCRPANLWNAIITQTGAPQAMPPQGFSTVAQFITDLQTSGFGIDAGDAMSGRFYPCGNEIASAHPGAMCLDTSYRDGHSYSHCLPVLSLSFTLPLEAVLGEDGADLE